MTLHNPIEYIAGENGRVAKVRLQKMELGEPDASGRRRPVEIPGAVEELDVDIVVVAIGVSPNPLIPSCLPELKQGKKGTILLVRFYWYGGLEPTALVVIVKSKIEKQIRLRIFDTLQNFF